MTEREESAAVELRRLIGARRRVLGLPGGPPALFIVRGLVRLLAELGASIEVRAGDLVWRYDGATEESPRIA